MCPQHSECINTQGSFYCRCHQGFTMYSGKQHGYVGLYRLAQLPILDSNHEPQTMIANSCEGEGTQKPINLFTIMRVLSFQHIEAKRFSLQGSASTTKSADWVREGSASGDAQISPVHFSANVRRGETFGWKAFDAWIPRILHVLSSHFLFFSRYNRLEYACIDRNECDQNKGMCGARSVCVNTHGSHRCIAPITCPAGGYYRKLMRTDEFGYRQVTMNICRRRGCKRITTDRSSLLACKRLPLSISYHYVSITSRLPTPAKLFRIKFPARRRRQQYNFSIVQGDRSAFSLRQMSMYRPRAYLMLNKALSGPAEHAVKVDMSTYDKRGRMRDNRMMTITVFVSEFNF